jgi:hypothetical protein
LLALWWTPRGNGIHRRAPSRPASGAGFGTFPAEVIAAPSACATPGSIMHFVGVTGLSWPELASPGTCIQIVAAVMIGVGLHKASRAAVAVSADEAYLPSADGGLGDPGQAAAAIGGGTARSVFGLARPGSPRTPDTGPRPAPTSCALSPGSSPRLSPQLNEQISNKDHPCIKRYVSNARLPHSWDVHSP